MTRIPQKASISFKNPWYFWVFILALLIILYRTLLLYTDAIMDDHEEEVALFMSLLFFVALGTGNYFSLLSPFQNQKNFTRLFAYLLVLIITCIILVLIAAEFRTAHRIFLSLLMMTLPLTILGIAIGLCFRIVKNNIEYQLDSAHAATEQSRSELKLLQSQLSPHFLFNTLNNLYGIAQTDHEKIPGLLLKLSDLLRYSVYDTKELLVPLSNEVGYINNYIDFEEIRIGHALVMTREVDAVHDSSLIIAPMILIVFVENAFKYAKESIEDKIYVAISLKVNLNTLSFSVRNSFVDSLSRKNTERNSGLGIKNTIRRLDLLYDGRYELSRMVKERFYVVDLKIDLR